MRQAAIYRNGELAGILSEENKNNYVFRYNTTYFTDKDKPAVSLTIPKAQQEYKIDYLFPFFFNMLSEGVNRQLQCKLLRIDEEDDFGLLIATAQYDTIGAITVKPLLQK